MTNQNKKLTIFLPLIISCSIVVGFVLATYLFQVEKEEYERLHKPTKLQELVDIIGMFYVDAIDIDSTEEIVIESLLSYLDPHSVYLSAEESNDGIDNLSGNFVGIGIQFFILRDSVLITNVIKGGGAYEAGLLIGDRIVAVDSVPMVGPGLTFDGVRDLILGEEGEFFKATIVRNNKTMVVDVKRKPVDIESVHYAVFDDIGYIHVSSFSENTDIQFSQAAKALKKRNIKSLILDLRDNTGGYMHIAVKILDHFFTEEKLLTYTNGARVKPSEFYSTGRRGDLANLPLVVLVNENSASASEITAGVIQDYDMGKIVGNVTFGKGLVQNVFYFNDKSTVRLTIARYYLPSGRCVQRSYEDGYIAYLENFYKRYGKNTQSVDSSKVFYTLKEGRKVYEGDGIMPDYTVEHDTSFYTPFIEKIIDASLTTEFCADYFDKNRTRIEENQVKTIAQLDKFLVKDKMFDKFLDLAHERNIEYTQEELAKSGQYLNKALRYQIAFYCFGTNRAYKIMVENDKYMDKAFELLK